MVIDAVISEAEARLKEGISDLYKVNFNFLPKSYGDEVLQAARIAVFKMTQNYAEYDINQIFGDEDQKKVLFTLIKEELREKSSELGHLVSLQTMINNKTRIADLVIVIEESKDDTEMSTGTISALFKELKSILNAGSPRRLFMPRTAYNLSVRRVYQEILKGNYNWKEFDPTFFRWDINLAEVIRISTEDEVLPYYGCCLEDLPIQDSLYNTMIKFKGGIHTKMLKFGLRDYLLLGFPEMKDSPHWHASRWFKPRILPEKERIEYSRFRRDYIFRYRLNCNIREDVLAALNDEARFNKAVADEKFPIYIGKNDWFNHPYKFIDGLKGTMYLIDPWELNRTLPDGTWIAPNGDLNLANVRRYLHWVKQKYDVKAINSSDYVGNVPHFGGFRAALTQKKMKAEDLAELIRDD